MLIPPHPGLSSAFGALAANWRVDRVQTIFGRSTHLNVDVIAERLEALTASALSELRTDGFAANPSCYAASTCATPARTMSGGATTARSLHGRGGRPDGGHFGRAHDDFYGFSLEDEPVEFVNLRVSAIGPTDLQTTVQLPNALRWSRSRGVPCHFAVEAISKRRSTGESCWGAGSL